MLFDGDETRTRVALALHAGVLHEFAMTCLGHVSERVNEEPQSARGRSKYSTYQNNFKAGRKSSSLMNLCGKTRFCSAVRGAIFAFVYGAFGFFFFI